MRNRIIPALAPLALLAAAGCDAGADGEARTQSMQQAGPGATAMVAEAVVYKSPTCGCCTGWIEHLRANGFEAEPVDLEQYAELSAKKAEHGVPSQLASCHTARIGGYTIEGHVPAEVVARLLREQPDDIVGLAVPGMPIGSPGMEGPNPEVYDVIAFDEAGNQSVYATIDPR